jgi:hypothetical protein
MKVNKEVFLQGVYSPVEKADRQTDTVKGQVKRELNQLDASQ